jgi:catecholate siderophore receptor
MGMDSLPTDLFNPTPHDAYLEDYQRTGGVTKADSSSQALYLSDSIQINEQWQINGGLRWDRFELDYTPNGSATLSRTDTMTSYRAGLVYKPVPEGSIYIGYGTSFNPTAEALSISTSSNQPGIADLDPEENRTLEIGTKWELMDRSLMLTTAVFRTEKTNARTQDPTDPNDLLVLQGEQLVQGVELGVAGDLTDQLSLFAGYTFLDSEITDSLNTGEIGKTLANSPEHSFNLWGTYTVNNNVQFGLGAMYVDDRFNNTSNERVAPGYWLGEASATWVMNDKVNVRFNIQNLTNEDYIDYVGGGHFIPGMGRLAMLSTNISF